VGSIRHSSLIRGFGFRHSDFLRRIPPMPTATELIDEGLKHHAAGQLTLAETKYREVLSREPENPAGLHLLGVLNSQQGRKETAVGLITRAITANPNIPEFHANLALVFLEKGEPEKAMQSARTALSLKPDYPDALNHLGNGLKQTGKIDQAIECYQRALAINPNFIDGLNNLADAYRRTGRTQEAESCYEKVLQLKGDHPEALLSKAELFRRQRKFGDAILICRRAIEIKPDFSEAYNTLGAAFQEQGNIAEAVTAYEKAIELQPTFAGAHSNLGYARHSLGEYDKAMVSYNKAIDLRPDMAEVHNNIGNLHRDLLDLPAALAAYDRGIYFQPAHTDSHWNRALAWLLLGDFDCGWPEYEWRWLNFPEERRPMRQPLWDGKYDISGKTILLTAEQGIGDTIQFVRLAPLVAAKGAMVNLECQRELEPLLQRAPGVYRTITRGDPLPPFDCYCPLLSLPHALDLKPGKIPAEIPYLTAHAPLVQRWRDVLAPHANTLKVGLVWAGSPIHRRDRERSVSLQSLAPLGRDGVTFISLQKGDPAREAAKPPDGLRLIDISNQLHDFADTAACLANLDLLITVDTAVAHLAGALGKPVWTLLSYNPDWRWLLGRDDSPWYPTMRLFRQSAPRDWSVPLKRVTEELGKLL
jgi:tetratricopeptide (TPR) repeat protein